MEDGEKTCRICGGEIIEAGTETEEAAAEQGLCLRCYEDENED